MAEKVIHHVRPTQRIPKEPRSQGDSGEHHGSQRAQLAGW